MSTRRFGHLEPRYTCYINPFVDLRFSRCPKCEGRTQTRRFALVVHVDPEGIFPTRVSCRWCRACGLVILHKCEFEETLKSGLASASPEQANSDYLILGTLEMRIWSRLSDGFATLETVRRWTSDFLNVVELQRTDSGKREILAPALHTTGHTSLCGSQAIIATQAAHSATTRNSASYPRLPGSGGRISPDSNTTG